MKYVQGKDRFQTEFTTSCLDDTIEADNTVRVLDAFVDSLPLEEFGFRFDYKEEGRPAYHPSDLLKLYIYGYQNSLRSSRKLEAECKRNIEVMWLLKGLRPDHHTINRFRKDNPEAIREVFRSTVKTAQRYNLIGGKLIAGDSTKLRAQNSKKNNYNQKKIDRHLAYIDRKLDEYNGQLAESDGDGEGSKKDEDNTPKKGGIKQEINKHQTQRKRYENLQKQLDESGEDQISTSDPDSRQMIIRGQITEVAYNVQCTTDDKHNLPIDYEVTNRNDSKAMGSMLQRAKEIIGHTNFTGLFDKGYHTTSEFEKADKLDIDVMVAIPGVSSHAPNPMFDVEKFIYNHKKDQYRCPAGRVLRSNGTWYNNRDKSARFKQYKTSACQGCLLRHACTKSDNGRVIQRAENAHLIEQNKERIMANPEIYKRRQAIVEHPFGTIKRQWGFDHIMSKKSLKRASADVGLIFVAYNLKRLMNILNPKQMGEVFGKAKGIYALIKALKHLESRLLSQISTPNRLLDKFLPFSLHRQVFGEKRICVSGL